jgi:hypothetical protein
MSEPIFKNLICKISQYDNDYSIRFYTPNSNMAIGIIRISNHNNNLLISSMDINELIGYVMLENNLPTEMGDTIVMTIRHKAIDEINNYIQKGGE